MRVSDSSQSTNFPRAGGFFLRSIFIFITHYIRLLRITEGFRKNTKKGKVYPARFCSAGAVRPTAETVLDPEQFQSPAPPADPSGVTADSVRG